MGKQITAEKLRSIANYDPETGLFTRKNGTKAGTLSHHGYMRMKIDDKSYAIHRLAWLYMTGNMPVTSIDHVDGDKLNNRFSNLREANRSQNNQNGRAAKRKIDLPRGVCISHPSGRFKASISLGNKRRHLGTFNTPAEASEFYQLAADMLHGEFAFHRCQGAAIAAAKGE
uniref:HNH endonuclease n=1 Tax=Comamonas testosteroni TaxID=285 RepID=UPI0015FB421F|nr:HNH endonuclease [Comamonas testosteroni]